MYCIADSSLESLVLIHYTSNHEPAVEYVNDYEKQQIFVFST